MISIRENPGFLTGLGTGLALSFIIGKLASLYGYNFTKNEDYSSDDDTGMWCAKLALGIKTMGPSR